MMMTIVQCTSAKQNVVIATYDKTVAIPPSISAIEDANIRQLAIEQLKSRSCTCTMVFDGHKYGFYSTQDTKPGTFNVSGENSIYMDCETKKMTSQKSILDKKYLVEDAYVSPQWEINKQKTTTVQGHKCIQAILKSNPKTVAWYCPEIPCQMGPDGSGGLPGLILKLETPSATFQLKDLKLDSCHPCTISSGQKGDRVTQREFDAIKEKKLKDMGVSGSGVHIIRM